ncbi:MAG: hypothetical protein HY898_26730 [Deltaproteobacteria bacterium]|nr:hypothetical protein [Deltaproteobacteria bacterium]
MHVTVRRIVAAWILLCALVLATRASAATWHGRGPVGAEPSVTTLSASPGRVIVQVDVPGVWTAPVQGAGESFEQLTLPQGSESAGLGQPGLPESGVPVILPQGRGVKARVLSVETETIGTFLPAPVQEKPCRCTTQANPRFLYDEASYRSSAPAGSAAEVLPMGWLRDVRLGVLRVRPVVYDKATHTVSLRRRIHVEIDFQAPEPSEIARRTFDDLPSSLGKVTAQIPLQLDSNWRSNTGPEHLLVIGPAAYLAAAKPLTDWRVETGTRVTLAPVESIGTTAADVKTYVQNAYDTWPEPLTALLLVGDEDAVPPAYGSASSAAADYLMSTLSGSDAVPDVLVGRIAARTTAEIDIQVAKIVAYEKQPSTGASAAWYQAGFLVSSSEGPGASNDDVWSGLIHDRMKTWGYDPLEKFYESLSTNTNANINSAINNGVSWISYLGHGSESAWASTDPLWESTTQVPNLTNGNRLPVIMDVACLNGAFDLQKPCFSEVWMNAQDRGAVGIWSSTVLAAWDEPAYWAVENTKAFTVSGAFRFGEVVTSGAVGLISGKGSGANVRAELEKFMIFGDPMLEIRSRAPAALEIVHPSAASVGGGMFNVAVQTGGVPVQDARVAASSAGSVLAVGLTDAAGQVNLVLPSLVTPSFVLTVTARDAIPVQHTVASQPPGCGMLVISEQGLLSCNQQLTVTVVDDDLNLSPTGVDQATVTVAVGTSTYPTLIDETGPDTHIFVGSVVFSSTPQGSEIGLADGDAITVTYQDAACQGSSLSLSKSLSAQCHPPTITGVVVDQISESAARVSWTTDVPADSTLDYGTTVNAGTIKTVHLLATSHQQTLTGLSKATTYYFRVSSADQVHNTATDDNGGAMYSFTTHVCDPKCAGKQCGGDGCGGECGTCSKDGTCNPANGHCECPTSSTPGCGGCPCEASVCAVDPFCCNVTWDGECAFKCLQFGGCAKPETDAGTDASGSDASDASMEDAGSGGGAGADGQAGSSGSSAAAGAAGNATDAGSSGKAGAAGASSQPLSDDSGDGCGCRVAGSARGPGAWLGALVALSWMAARRRRASQRTLDHP